MLGRRMVVFAKPHMVLGAHMLTAGQSREAAEDVILQTCNRPLHMWWALVHMPMCEIGAMLEAAAHLMGPAIGVHPRHWPPCCSLPALLVLGPCQSKRSCPYAPHRVLPPAHRQGSVMNNLHTLGISWVTLGHTGSGLHCLSRFPLSLRIASDDVPCMLHCLF